MTIILLATPTLDESAVSAAYYCAAMADCLARRCESSPPEVIFSVASSGECFLLALSSAALLVAYVDLGVTLEMKRAFRRARRAEIPIEKRRLAAWR